MLQLPEKNLDQQWQTYLNTWQQEINAIASYAEQVQQAKTNWNSGLQVKNIIHIMK